MSLPLFQTPDQTLSLLQTRWKSVLDPVISEPFNSGQILASIALNNGVTVINHKLGRVQQGWIITDIQGSASIYREAAFNALTLTLSSSAAVTVNIFVF